MKRRKLRAHDDAQLGVEVRQRLVQKEDAWPADDRAADRDALTLAPRELAGLAREKRFDEEHSRHLAHARIDFGARHPAVLESECEVLANTHMRIERV